MIRTRYNNKVGKDPILSKKIQEIVIPSDLFENQHYNYDYIEIHPSVISGSSSSCIYFFGHNPG